MGVQKGKSEFEYFKSVEWPLGAAHASEIYNSYPFHTSLIIIHWHCFLTNEILWLREGKNYLLPKKKPTLKYDNSEAMTAKWSDHKLPSDFHDIYYYRGDVSEKMEEKCERLKVRFFITP